MHNISQEAMGIYDELAKKLKNQHFETFGPFGRRSILDWLNNPAIQAFLKKYPSIKSTFKSRLQSLQTTARIQEQHRLVEEQRAPLDAFPPSSSTLRRRIEEETFECDFVNGNGENLW